MAKVYWIAFRSLLSKEIKRFLRIWIQTLFPPAITMTLYFVIFGHLIGSRIGLMSGVTYMEYIMPGLIMMSVITNAYSNVASSFFSAKLQKNIEELLVAPVPNDVIIAGYVMGGVCRSLIVGGIVTFVSLLFIPLQVKHWGIVISIAAFTAILFSLAGLINALFARSFDDISLIPTFVLTPLTYLGGVFYSLNLLPEFWQNVSKANPIVYLINGFRYGFLGIADVEIETAFTVLVGFIIMLYAIAHRLIHTGKGLRN